MLEGDLYDLRIEVVPALLPDELEDFVERPGLLVAPVGAERFEHVGKGGDDTLFATADGIVKYERLGKDKRSALGKAIIKALSSAKENISDRGH